MSAGRLALQRPASELAGQDLEQLYLQHMAGHVERAA